MKLHAAYVRVYVWNVRTQQGKQQLPVISQWMI